MWHKPLVDSIRGKTIMDTTTFDQALSAFLSPGDRRRTEAIAQLGAIGFDRKACGLEVLSLDELGAVLAAAMALIQTQPADSSGTIASNDSDPGLTAAMAEPFPAVRPGANDQAWRDRFQPSALENIRQILWSGSVL